MSETLRVFFALWPQEEVRQAIAAQTKSLLQGKDRAVAAANLHITLAFVGNIEKQKLPDYLQAAQKVHASAFELKLDQLGCFPRAQILWLGCSLVITELQALVSRLNTELQHCGYIPDSRPFTPHVTLARKYRKKPEQTVSVAIPWGVHDFSLVESRSTTDGVEYHVLQSWPLQVDDSTAG